ETPAPSVASAEMKKLEFLVGQWKGPGWLEVGRERRTFVETESVQFKQDGLLLLIEGSGKGKAASQDAESSVHNALGLVFYDPATRRHVFPAYKGGKFVAIALQVPGRGFQWSFREPRSNGTIRFTMKLTDSDRWFEIGEFSQDGTDWHKFFEMTLGRSPRSSAVSSRE